MYLIGVIFYVPVEYEGLHIIFPKNSGKIKADWYTGDLKIPLGDIIISYYNNWDSVYEYDWFISIKKGNFISQRYQANY